VVEETRIEIVRDHLPPPAEVSNGFGGRSRDAARARAQKNRASQEIDHIPDSVNIRLFPATVCTLGNIHHGSARGLVRLAEPGRAADGGGFHAVIGGKLRV
jgi:hypothetical protein